MDELRLTKAIAGISREHVLEIARVICRVGQPEGREGPRAEVVAGFLDHPRIELLLDPVLPGRPNVVARVRGTGTGPVFSSTGISTPGTRRTGAGIRTTPGSPGIACTERV